MVYYYSTPLWAGWDWTDLVLCNHDRCRADERAGDMDTGDMGELGYGGGMEHDDDSGVGRSPVGKLEENRPSTTHNHYVLAG